MALTVGTRLGHYDVTALLGEGGMGQVWQASDTKQLMDVVFTVGQYNLVSMALKTFRVPMDDGIEGFPR